MVTIEETPTAFIVTTSTGYRASLPACRADACVNGSRVPCAKPVGDNHRHAGMSVNRWLAHVKTHCHGWHTETARAFADDVARTFGSAKRVKATPSGLLPHPKRVRDVGAKAWADDPYAAALEGRGPALPVDEHATREEWGHSAEHAVEAVRELTERFGFAPNYNMLALATTLRSGLLCMCAIGRARDAKLIEARGPGFGGCVDGGYVVLADAR